MKHYLFKFIAINKIKREIIKYREEKSKKRTNSSFVLSFFLVLEKKNFVSFYFHGEMGE